MRRAPALLALGVALAAGTAQARPDPAEVLAKAVLPARGPSHAPPAASAPAPDRLDDVAQTAIDHRFDRTLEGAVGFLCGIQDSRAENAGTAVLGHDPHGRFLGAQLKLAFR